MFAYPNMPSQLPLCASQLRPSVCHHSAASTNQWVMLLANTQVAMILSSTPSSLLASQSHRPPGHVCVGAADDHRRHNNYGATKAIMSVRPWEFEAMVILVSLGYMRVCDNIVAACLASHSDSCLPAGLRLEPRTFEHARRSAATMPSLQCLAKTCASWHYSVQPQNVSQTLLWLKQVRFSGEQRCLCLL